MGNATSIYNLLRNLGGSFGVAFVTTMLERRAQFHQFRLIENLTPFDSTYQWATEKVSELLQLRGLPSHISEIAGSGVIYRGLLRESSMIAFNDAFHLLSILMILILPLVLLMRRGRGVPK